MTGRVRIIGGRWRRRVLPVPPDPGLRPTPDRVKETLFNWLGRDTEGARCLDLFAGTGSLGLEAASRGASSVVLVERSPDLARRLEDQARALGADNVTVVTADALAWLSRARDAFDLVLLDPPFDADLLGPACAALARTGLLAPGARVYLETRLAQDALPVPEDWEILRARRAGQVRYYLALARPGTG